MSYKIIDVSKINKLIEINSIALNKAGEQNKTEDVTPMTPIETGELRQNTRVEHSTPKNLSLTTYNTSQHALATHENTRGVTFKEEGTSEKWLEVPFVNHMGKKFVKAVRKELRKNGF